MSPILNWALLGATDGMGGRGTAGNTVGALGPWGTAGAAAAFVRPEGGVETGRTRGAGELGRAARTTDFADLRVDLTAAGRAARARAERRDIGSLW